MLSALPDLRFDGHALVSADGMIADGHNIMPKALHNAADWSRFQAALSEAAIVASGRKGHETHPNPTRRRLVLTRSVADLAPATGRATFWNPAGIDLNGALTSLGITSGTVAIAGVFDVFVPHYDRFSLAEMHQLVLPGGTPCFSTGHPRTVLAAAGLFPSDPELIDPEAGVTLTHWERR